MQKYTVTLLHDDELTESRSWAVEAHEGDNLCVSNTAMGLGVALRGAKKRFAGFAFAVDGRLYSYKVQPVPPERELRRMLSRRARSVAKETKP